MRVAHITTVPVLMAAKAMLLLSLLPLQAVAEPRIILDRGGVSTESYRRVLDNTQVPDFGGEWVQTYSPRIQKEPQNPQVWLPLSSDKLSPAKLEVVQEVYYATLETPICIIGSDPLSLRWLKTNLQNLIDVKARCWLVQAKNFNDFSTVSKLLNGRVLMTPADGDAVADFFKIKHYPVIIDQRYISQ